MKQLDFGIDPWEAPVVKGRKMHFNPRPSIPVTGWKRPVNFPDLSGAGAICLDVETYDPELKEHGAGWGRGKGHIVGLAIATDDGFKAYYPVRHEECAEDNFPPEVVFAWAREQLSRKNQWKVGHNLLYDLGFLATEGVDVKGPLWDTWISERLIHHREDASLEATGQRRVGEGKVATLLLRWLSDYFGRGPTPEKDFDLDGAMKGYIYKAPPSLVGPYALSDVELPLRIADVQATIMEKMGLMQVFRMENGILPVLVGMRMEGISVDLRKAEEADVGLGKEIVVLQREIDHIVGAHLEVNSGPKVGAYLVSQGFKLPTTETGQHSVKEEILKKIDHPVAEKIIDLKELMKFQSTFIRSYVLDSAVKGRIHANFNQMKAITGRFSSSQPNLTNIPSRNPELMKMIRSVFIPDPGHDHFRKYDYSQVECRILAHYATGRGADALRAEYNAKPSTNYHKFTHAMILQQSGIDLPHKSVKAVNFAIIYSAGQAKLAKMIGLSKEEVEPFFETYHNSLPFVRDTMDSISRSTNQNGYTSTILGRQVPFDRWEPKFREGDERFSFPLDEAVRKFGTQIKRAFVHKSINYTIQGSAADLLKAAILQCWQEGVYDVIGLPKGFIHDEKIFSVRDDSKATNDAFHRMKEIMQTAVKFRVPILASSERGSSWGETEEFD